MVTGESAQKSGRPSTYTAERGSQGRSKCEIPWEFLCCNDDVIFFSEKKMTSSLQHKNSWGILHLEPP